MSNNKRSIVLPRLETVEEGGILMSDLENHDNFNDNESKPVRRLTISITILIS